MITIFDVAKEAGVSKSTVSRVVNGDAGVSEATKKRVKAAIKKLNYSPSFFAKGIRTGETHTIALVVPEYTNMFYGEMFNGVEDVAIKHDYAVIVSNAGNVKSEEDYLDKLVSRNVDGIIYNTYKENPDIIDYLKRVSKKMPVVLMDEFLGKRNELSAVYTDGYKSTKKAVRYLYDTGCDRIGYIQNMDSIEATKERYRGYQDGLKECQLPFTEAFSYQIPLRKEINYIRAGMEAADYFLSLEEQPNAIMAAIDLLAIGCVSRLVKAGKQVPDDISVIGYDNIELGELNNPPISTISQPTRKMGQLAAEMVIDQLRKREFDIETKVFEGVLVCRDTTKKVSDE